MTDVDTDTSCWKRAVWVSVSTWGPQPSVSVAAALALIMMMKPIKFPEYFPAVAAMFITGDKIYVVTFKTTPLDDSTDNFDVLVFDLKGKFLKKILLPVKMMDPIQFYPYTIHEGKMYQLVENEDEEAYEVHITEIK